MKNEVLDDLKEIKKDYGENMMHLCRSLFPTILEQPGLLYYVLSTHFAKSRSLYDDIVSEYKEDVFKEYIYSFVDVESRKDQIIIKSVKELLDKAGYEIYECETNEDIQRFRKYYRSDEALCTFSDPHRIDSHYIFFIVKKDVDRIKREDFKDPRREDTYGISVLDLQFDKGTRQRVSIKSRYNHTVNNPDATYSNNLDAIVPGLTEAFEREYGFNIGGEYKVNFGLADYVEARNGKFYKYNYEIDNIHYCPNNIIIDNGNVVETYSDKARYVFMDYFILDLQTKKLILYDEGMGDSFVDGLQNITRVEVLNNEGYKEIKLTLEENKEAIIKLDSRGRIISYENKNLKRCGDDFLYHNETLQVLSLPNLENCGDGFMSRNDSLQTLDLPNLIRCGSYFLFENNLLQTVNLPSLVACGDDFLYMNNSLQILSLPSLIRCGDKFLWYNNSLQTVNLPNLEECGDNFLSENDDSLQTLDLPNLIRCGHCFLTSNRTLQVLNLPNLEECGDDFLIDNEDSLQTVNLPRLARCGDRFLFLNNSLKILNLPSLEVCGFYFLCYNNSLKVLNLACGSNFVFVKYSGLNEYIKSLLSSNEATVENSSKGVKK